MLNAHLRTRAVLAATLARPRRVTTRSRIALGARRFANWPFPNLLMIRRPLINLLLQAELEGIVLNAEHHEHADVSSGQGGVGLIMLRGLGVEFGRYANSA